MPAHHQVDLLTLPLPHCWFEAETALPAHRFKAANLGTGSDALLGVARRTQGAELADKARPEDNTLDGAQRSFDTYFNVLRADDLPIPQYRAALGQTLKGCYLDVQTGVSLTDREIEVLSLGLHRLADWAQFPTTVDSADDTPWEAHSPSQLYRWKQQHHLFFVIVHGMLYLLHVLEEALDKSHAPVVRAILQDFAELMEASEVAFRLASDFSQEAYDTEIRPDMFAFDPHFSGLFYADHKELITRLRVLRRVGSDFGEELDRINAAITQSYEAHALVCLRFVGETSSLASKDETRVAAESIRNKYVKRTKTIAGFGKDG
ncbi:hypothetical protein [Litoreibacter albidus]|uniref:Uncharacterized protein n=1 Tax=Litoreibacter albidus TaxID=670155 RepID=A0A1H3AX09_9RHOB|nr:hypothetical protein [Litoreibacter albidus]SDX34270.1 hypothetical protein SAMN04488001_2965 [Litoreibacter albidus]